MKKEDMIVLGQLLHSMRNAIDKLEDYHRMEDMENLLVMKKEILRLHAEIDKIVK
jgi:hypothetical protein